MSINVWPELWSFLDLTLIDNRNLLQVHYQNQNQHPANYEKTPHSQPQKLTKKCCASLPQIKMCALPCARAAQLTDLCGTARSPPLPPSPLPSDASLCRGDCVRDQIINATASGRRALSFSRFVTKISTGPCWLLVVRLIRAFDGSTEFNWMKRPTRLMVGSMYYKSDTLCYQFCKEN